MTSTAALLSPSIEASGAPVPTRRIAVLVNPAAGRHDMGAVERLVAALRRNGAEVRTVVSRARGSLATALAGLDADTVVVAGGDGTINEVVGALVALPAPRPRLAVVPQGTADVLAHEYRLPSDMERIAAAILADRTRPLHLGVATDTVGRRRPFFLMASVGFDAEVVHAVERRVKKRFKKLAFLVTALRHGARELPMAVISVTDQAGVVTRIAAALAIVTKAAHYGGPFVLTRETAIDRPGLRLVALKHGSALALVGAALRLVFGRLEGSRDVVSRPVGKVRLSSRSRMQELAVQIDGEPWGETPIEIEPLDAVVDLVVA